MRQVEVGSDRTGSPLFNFVREDVAVRITDRSSPELSHEQNAVATRAELGYGRNRDTAFPLPTRSSALHQREIL